MVGGIPALPPVPVVTYDKSYVASVDVKSYKRKMEIVEDLCLAANIAGLIKMSCELQTSQNTHSLVFIYSFQAPMVARETTEKK